jgi:hypothetical protein
MKAFRLSDEMRSAVDAAVSAATAERMTRAEEVKALMAKGMKIVSSRGHCSWAFAPRKIAASMGAPFIAVMPAFDDLPAYLSLGGQIIQAV